MKFIHGADLHIDRAFEGLKDLPKSWQKQLSSENQKVLTKIVDHALEHRVDFLLLVGDTFHQQRPSVPTQAFFVKEMKRLQQANIPVFLSFGNHDFFSAERYWFDFPDNVYLFSSENVQTHTLQLSSGEQIAISGFSYQHPWIIEEKAMEFPPRFSNVAYHIGMYHGGFRQQQETARQYAPFTLSQMQDKGYDYWALGHIHEKEKLSVSPLIVYSGTPQGHTKKEQGSRFIACVTLSKGQQSVEWLPTSQVTWEVLEVSLAEFSDFQTASTVILQEIQQLVLASPSSYQLVGLTIKDWEQVAEFATNDTKGINELLDYFQIRIEGILRNRVWLYAIKVQQKVVETDFILTQELLETVAEPYQEKEKFREVVADLVSNPFLAQIINTDLPQRETILQKAIENMKQIYADKKESGH